MDNGSGRRGALARGWSRLSSMALFVRAREGDSAAVSRLFSRLLPSLRRWTRGKLPLWARHRVDTDDIVQDALVNLHRHLKDIEPRRRDALGAYLRQSIRNRIRDEIRRGERVEVGGVSVSSAVDPQDSPADCAEERDNADHYQRALLRLDPKEQELIVGRLELGYSYEQLALATGRPSADAARVAVRRSLIRLAEEIARG